jgi:glycosyltransferase involved in cell wall biosynthesis
MTFQEFIDKYQKVPVEEYQNNVLEMVPNPMVSCRVSTYQHAPYIRQCLDGILMQKTNFLFEIVIGEDESSDGTTEICLEYAKKYPDIIRLFLHKRENNILIDGNPSAKFQSTYTRYKLRGKYQAICEGDDYWTDPYKLQKQVDFLEENPEYGMVHSELGHYYYRTGKYVERHWETSGVTKQSGDIYESLIIGRESMVYFCTALFRASLQNHGLHDPRVKMEDKPLAIWIALNSKIGYFDTPMAVRNVLMFSATQGQKPRIMLEFYQSESIIFQYFNAIRPVSQFVEKQFYIKYYSLIANHCFINKIGKEQFNEAYSFLKKNKPTLIIYLQKLGFLNSTMYLIIFLGIRIYRRLEYYFLSKYRGPVLIKSTNNSYN